MSSEHPLSPIEDPWIPNGAVQPKDHSPRAMLASMLTNQFEYLQLLRDLRAAHWNAIGLDILNSRIERTARLIERGRKCLEATK